MTTWYKVEDKLPPKVNPGKFWESIPVLIVLDGTMINPKGELGKNNPFWPEVGIGLYVTGRKGKPYWAVSQHPGTYFGCIFEDAEGQETWGKVTHWAYLPKLPKECKHEN